MPAIKSTTLGKGSPVIFIHGFCETREMWFPYVEPLAKDYKIICVDLPGYDESPLESMELSLEEVADQLAGWFDSQGINKAVIIGHSLGGYVALLFSTLGHPT